MLRFRKHLPGFENYFANPVSDNDIWMCGYLGSRSSNPERDPANTEAWQEARRMIDGRMAVEFYRY